MSRVAHGAGSEFPHRVELVKQGVTIIVLVTELQMTSSNVGEAGFTSTCVLVLSPGLQHVERPAEMRRTSQAIIR
jgi:hypothetical protein